MFDEATKVAVGDILGVEVVGVVADAEDVVLFFEVLHAAIINIAVIAKSRLVFIGKKMVCK
jgi:hypothetical protein